MKEMLYRLVGAIAKIHSLLLSLNDKYEYDFTDKQLHFWVIGVLGMILVFAIHPVFSLLAKKGHTIVITWIYVFTLILGITFAIEIGQGITHTGVMEFNDIVFGVVGFILMFGIFLVVRWIVKGISKLISRTKKEK